jgi:hypothetical protein
MSTQRRVVRWQRTSSTERTGDPLSPDGGVLGSSFGCAVRGRTASLSGSFPCGKYGKRELATNSLSFSSSCTWVRRNTLGCFLFHEVEQHDRFFSGTAEVADRKSLPNSFPSSFSGFLPSYPALPGGHTGVQLFIAVGLAAVPTGLSRGTERQHGQGNLYFEHAA